jgi:hypothetical protein
MDCTGTGKNNAGRVLLQEIQEKVGANDATKKNSKMHPIFDFSNITHVCPNSRNIPTFETERQEHASSNLDHPQTRNENVFIHEESSFDEDNNEAASGFKDENDDHSTPEKKVNTCMMTIEFGLILLYAGIR